MFSRREKRRAFPPPPCPSGLEAWIFPRLKNITQERRDLNHFAGRGGEEREGGRGTSGSCPEFVVFSTNRTYFCVYLGRVSCGSSRHARTEPPPPPPFSLLGGSVFGRRTSHSFVFWSPAKTLEVVSTTFVFLRVKLASTHNSYYVLVGGVCWLRKKEAKR